MSAGKLHQALKQQLLNLVAEDDRLRDELAADGSLFEGYHPVMEEVHRQNAAALRAIIRKHGWPGIDLVGKEGAEAAWRIAQHSIGEPQFMREALRLVKAASEKGQAPLYQVAYLEDRIRMFEGKLQLYGTSFDWNEEGELAPFPDIEKPEQVDTRRAEMGLPPLRARQKSERESPPKDLHKRREQMKAWAKSVGW
jgi:hypothetical protein